MSTKKTKTEENKSMDYLNALVENGSGREGQKPSIIEVSAKLGVNRSTVYRMVEKYVREGILDKEYRLTEAGRDWLEERNIKKARLETWMLHSQVAETNIPANTAVILDGCTADLVAFICNTGLMCNCCDRRVAANAFQWFGLPGTRFKDKLGRLIPDGSYETAFLFFKDNDQELLELSMASRGFEQPAVLELRGGEGCVCLKLRTMSQQAVSGKWFSGAVKTMKYKQDSEWHAAEITDCAAAIPLSAFWLTYEGEDHKCIRGMVSVKITCSVGREAMEESAALMQIRILRA